MADFLDANPEAIVIGSPLDGTKNPDDTKLGDFVGEVTGVVTYAFGFYRILPLTAIKVSKRSNSEHPAVSFTSKESCKGITVADYNTENLNPESAHLPLVVGQIVEKLRTPDLIFLQEVQDNSGAANDGVVSANKTLAALADGIEAASGVVYEWAEVVPDNNVDGGQPGGNIRQAYLYRPDVVQLVKPNEGSASDVNAVLDGPTLKFNPGRIDPANSVWDNSRKPLAAEWKPVKGTKKSFFTVNVHFGSKGGSSSIHGDARTPVNKGVEKRTKQSEVTAVSSIFSSSFHDKLTFCRISLHRSSRRTRRLTLLWLVTLTSLPTLNQSILSSRPPVSLILTMPPRSP